MEHVTATEATVDGAKIENLESYIVKSPLFNFTYPENNIGGVAPGPSQALSDGFWIMLHPLQTGEHTVHFRGVAVDPTVTGTANFVTDVTYHLTVSNSTTTTQTTAGALENITNSTTSR